MKHAIVLAFFTLILFPDLMAQQESSEADSVAQSDIDSESTSLIDSLFIKTDTVKTETENYQTLGSVLNKVINKAQQHAIALSEIKLKLSEDFDTVRLSKDLPSIHDLAINIRGNVIEDQEFINIRYLKGLDNLINTLNEVNQGHINEINARVNEFNDLNVKITEIKSDSLFNLSLRDSTLVPIINSELKTLRNTLKSIDSTYLNKEITLVKFQAAASENAILLMELQEFLISNQRRLAEESLTKEINYPWEPSENEQPLTFFEITKQSTLINLLILVLFLGRNYIAFILTALVFISVYIFLKRVVKRISNENEFASLILDRVKYFRNHTLAATTVLLLPFFFVFYHKPPLIFASLLSLLLTIGSVYLVKGQFGKQFHKYFLLFLTPYILIALSGLQWKIAYQERWFILLCSILFITMGILILKDLRHKKFTGSKFLRIATIFLLIFQIASLVFNIMGRFTLSKTFAVTGVVNFYRAVGLFLFILVTMEAVYLIIEYNKKGTNGFTSFFDFQDLQKRMKGLLIAFSLSIWAYGLVWHLGLYDKFYNTIEGFLTTSRTLGNTEFQFGSILLFIIILYISTFLANNIAYFASMKDQSTTRTRKQRLGSSVLLIRLGIVFLGFFIAATAAKIPLDSIAIVLGALSVGIGFGLQTIINNLVSGIILAFERPIQIGDEIEVGQNIGTVKDVGIRASKIQAYDGSEVVIPNGDLLSQSLINWTLSDKRRRIELFVGVGYGSDMKKVKSVIEGVLDRDKILKAPSPRVLMQNFGSSSVDFRLLFWVETMDIWIDMRSEVMNAIFEAFGENDIEIPFPKRDLYIKGLPGMWKEKISGPGEGLPSDLKDIDEEPPTQE